MRYLFADWDRVKKRLAGRHVFLLMDFDGTLAAIRRHPARARLSGEAARTLRNILACREDISLAVVSGRSLRDIRLRVGIKGILYAGNHGLEAEGPGIKFTVPEALRAKKTVKKISRELKKGYKGFKGIVVEDKGLTISVHFRMVSPARIAEAEKTMEDIAAPYRAKGKIDVMTGKKVWEIRPPVKWNKGKAAIRLINEKKKALNRKILPVYVGDDRTDEDAFRAIGEKGICVFVGGKRSSNAAYYLNGTREVIKFLQNVIAVKQGS
jgi:trehalose 6-phosphate phosphatase